MNLWVSSQNLNIFDYFPDIPHGLEKSPTPEEKVQTHKFTNFPVDDSDEDKEEVSLYDIHQISSTNFIKKSPSIQLYIWSNSRCEWDVFFYLNGEVYFYATR